MDSLLNHTKHGLFDQTLMFLLTKLFNCPRRGLVPHCECSSPNGSSGSESDMPCPPDVPSVTPAKRADASSSTPGVKLCRVLTHAKLAENAALPTPPVFPPSLGDALLVIDSNSVPEPPPVLVPTSDLAPVFLHMLIPSLAQNTTIQPCKRQPADPALSQQSLPCACKCTRLTDRTNSPCTACKARTCKKSLTICKNNHPFFMEE
ncbi:hypothetical protein DSO57_1032759 [Entomophthora muscae]|uniref:Uncharacterized protein n=1 Tax=Entomophthora muscae TaxID=34485 RepID=A0ACC2TBQ7_9FUNG|nr:hypothetical protein DSO57_1032759 [Entomophthora muscae]